MSPPVTMPLPQRRSRKQHGAAKLPAFLGYVLALSLACILGRLGLADEAAKSPAVRFVLLSDIHLDAGRNAFREAIQEINAMDPKPVAMLITGDLTINGFAEQYDTFLAEAANLDKSIPLLPVPGNHEVLGDTDCLKGYQEKIRKDLYYSQDIAGIHFIGLSPLPLNKASHPERDDRTHKGYMDAPQLEWLAKDLASPAAQQATWVIMFDHFPLWGDYGAYEIQNVEWEGKPNNGQKRIIELMELNKVGAFLVGHRHHANMPPIVHNFSNGSFAMHIMNETTALTRRPGYNVYEVSDRQISSYRKVLGSCRLNGGQRLYHVAFNNPRKTGGLASAPELHSLVNEQAVKLEWNPVKAGHVEIHRRIEASDFPWILVETVPSAEGSFLDTTTSDGVAYSYRIRVKTGEGFSGFSNTAPAAIGEVKQPAKPVK
jgi:hypothetical protein